MPKKRKTTKPLNYKTLAKVYILILTIIGFTIVLYLQEQKKWLVSPTSDTARINVCFTPPAGCQPLIINAINTAKKTILVQAYGFTSEEIFEALEEAARRGVRVEIILDKSNVRAKYSLYRYANTSLSKFYIDYKTQGISHNKVMVIDDKLVITGSYNFSKSAEFKNAENLLLINDPEIAKIYKQNWLKFKPVNKNSNKY